jgi:hypothetical protein
LPTGRWSWTCGHITLAEQPEAFAEAVADFTV